MKHLLTFAIATVCGLASSSCEAVQEVQNATAPHRSSVSSTNQFTSSASDAYGRRLRRYQNNYGHNNNHYYRNSGRNGYRSHDYYGGNYGRVRDYRNHYRSNPNNGYYNGYYSRPGFTIGGGSSRVFFGF